MPRTSKPGKQMFRKTMKLSSIPTYAHAIKWHDHLFEHLGWMVLANASGYNDKIQVYKNSIQRFKTNIKAKMEKMNDAFRKEELQILYDHVCVLEQHVARDF
jgi:hypothetical protein